jgi:hypothetical protein
MILATTACAGNIDPRWELRHDRIIAIRTTPAAVPANATSVIDALVTSVDEDVTVEPPLTATAAAGTTASLVSTITPGAAGGWQVTAPDEATLGAARSALGLGGAAPVPLVIDTSFMVGGETLGGTKTVWFGASVDNPVVGTVTIDGVAPAAALSVPFDHDVMLAIDVDSTFAVHWFTSCGSLDNDDNEHAAILHVHPGDSTSGQLAVVVRDTMGGVSWQSWPIRSVN